MGDKNNSSLSLAVFGVQNFYKIKNCIWQTNAYIKRHPFIKLSGITFSVTELGWVKQLNARVRVDKLGSTAVQIDTEYGATEAWGCHKVQLRLQQFCIYFLLGVLFFYFGSPSVIRPGHVVIFCMRCTTTAAMRQRCRWMKEIETESLSLSERQWEREREWGEDDVVGLH